MAEQSRLAILPLKYFYFCLVIGQFSGRLTEPVCHLAVCSDCSSLLPVVRDSAVSRGAFASPALWISAGRCPTPAAKQVLCSACCSQLCSHKSSVAFRVRYCWGKMFVLRLHKPSMLISKEPSLSKVWFMVIFSFMSHWDLWFSLQWIKIRFLL